MRYLRWGAERGARAATIVALAGAVAGVLVPAAAAGNGHGGHGDSSTSAPIETTIVSGPQEGSQTTATDVTVAFEASVKGVKFQCRLDSESFRPCNSPFGASAGYGRHTFSVRAQDRSGNTDPTPATVSWASLPWVSTATYPADSLLGRAQAAPFDMFRVIVETQSWQLQKALAAYSGQHGKLKHEYVTIPAINAKLPGWALLAIDENQAYFGPTSIVEDAPVTLSGFEPVQLWPAAMTADRLWDREEVSCTTDPATGLPTDPSCIATAAFTLPAPPTIAIVDSGVDATRAADFGARVVANVGLSDLAPGAIADGRGHGTFVASIGAGSATAYPGASPKANIVSIRVMDDEGKALTSDVIEAADWIYRHKDEYGIRVANFSLHAARPGSFKFDPLDHAVERLWFSGVTVVTAAGNFGDGTAQRMAYAPGNDPFVITVGAADISDTVATGDDIVPSWSAYGYTLDGFAKPDVVAPGRYMVGAVPETATLYAERADHVVAPGYMRLSGTSFSAPAVAGAAANLLALHPDWTPDQVKGALMVRAHRLPLVPPLAQGRGTVDEAASAALSSPPNPNRGLDRYVGADPSLDGAYAFDAVSWDSAAKSDVSWDSVSWSDVSWSDVSWSDVSWSDVSWSDVSWASVSWSDSADADASLADVSWSDVSWADNASGD